MTDAGQSITYIDIGVHQQNIIEEAHIKHFMLVALTMLLHAKRHWPEAITTMLWPYDNKVVEACHNQFHLNNDAL